MAEKTENSLQSTLRRYLAIQTQEQQLKAEKSELQQLLAGHMSKSGMNKWYPDVDGQKVRVMHVELMTYEYDEEMLRRRLTDRYQAILQPDIKKVKRSLEDIETVLLPVIDKVGSPSTVRINSVIARGIAEKSEFHGTFRIKTRDSINVCRIRPLS